MIGWETDRELDIETTNPSKTANIELGFAKNPKGHVRVCVKVPSAFVEMHGALDLKELESFKENWHAFDLQTRNRISVKFRGSESIVETQFVSMMDYIGIVFMSENRTVEVMLSDEDANHISWFLRDFVQEWGEES